MQRGQQTLAHQSGQGGRSPGLWIGVDLHAAAVGAEQGVRQQLEGVAPAAVSHMLQQRQHLDLLAGIEDDFFAGGRKDDLPLEKRARFKG